MRTLSTTLAAVGVLLTAGATPYAQLSELEPSRPNLSRASTRGVSRPAPRNATLGRARLSLTAGELRQGPVRLELPVELGDGRPRLARLARYAETRSGGVTWFGALEGSADDYLALAAHDDALVGTLRANGVLYRLRSRNGGPAELEELDPAAELPCGNDAESSSATTAPASLAPPPPARSESPTPTPRQRVRTLPGRITGEPRVREWDLPQHQVVDVLVGWTQEAEDAAGGESAIQALIDLAMLETQTAFLQSRVRITLRLVYSGRVAYVESGDMATDLHRLRETNDGYMDEIHTWRDTYGADVVSLFVENDTKAGRSYNMGRIPPGETFAESAFNLVSQSNATGYYAFAHELGHNFGLDHDRPNTKNTPSHPYAYGHWLEDDTHRTIMALERGTNAGVRILYFSNPTLEYEGMSLGRPLSRPWASHCAHALNVNAPVLASWRPEAVAVAAEETAGSTARVSLAVYRESGSGRAEWLAVELEKRGGASPFGDYLLATGAPIPSLPPLQPSLDPGPGHQASRSRAPGRYAGHPGFRSRVDLRAASRTLLGWSRLERGTWTREPAGGLLRLPHPDVLRGEPLHLSLVTYDPLRRELELGAARSLSLSE